MRCTYCNAHFLRKDGKRVPIISTDLLSLIFKSISSLSPSEVAIHWYGGEPLLAGVEFYEQALALEKQYLPNSRIYNSLNTNGTLLNTDYINFFTKQNFHVSVSVDGGNYLHNRLRFADENSYLYLKDKLLWLKEQGFPLVVALVVSKVNYSEAKSIFFYFRELGIKQLRLFPCFNKDPKGELTSLTISNDEYFFFLRDLFDEWIKERMPFKINLFSEMFRGIIQHRYSLCYLSGNCSSINIDEEGNIYSSCEVQNKDTFLGNIQEESFIRLLSRHRKRLTGLSQDETFLLLEKGLEVVKKKSYKLCYQYKYKDRNSYFYLDSLHNLQSHIKKILPGLDIKKQFGESKKGEKK